MGEKSVHKELKRDFGTIAVGFAKKLVHHAGGVVVRNEKVIVLHLARFIIHNAHLTVLIAVHPVDISLYAEALEKGFAAQFQADNAETGRAGAGQQVDIVPERSAHIAEQHLLQHQVAAAHLHAVHLFQHEGADEAAQFVRIFQRALQIGRCHQFHAVQLLHHLVEHVAQHACVQRLRHLVLRL